MRVFIKLGLNTEYHGYDIYLGVFRSIEDAIKEETKNLSRIDNLGYLTYTHVDDYDDCYAYSHTHIIFFNKDFGMPSWEELTKAIDFDNEDEFHDTNYVVISSIVLQEEQI